jgi:glutathione S-transferase
MGISRADRQKWEALGKDVVVVHQFGKGTKSPSSSPFPMKLETYLRIADIKFECDHKNWKSPKGKSPWITINGKDISDSQLCINYLSETLNKDISSHLSREDAAVARSMQVTIDERFYWAFALDRLIFNKGAHVKNIATLPGPAFMQPMIVKLIARGINKQAIAHGIGRHSEEEIKKLALGDLKAFSDYLGNKPFLMGDTPTLVDCSLFAFMASVVYTTPEGNFMKEALKKDYTNLVDYVDRVKEKYWPDWDQCLKGGEEKKASEEKKD